MIQNIIIMACEYLESPPAYLSVSFAFALLVILNGQNSNLYKKVVLTGTIKKRGKKFFTMFSAFHLMLQDLSNS